MIELVNVTKVFHAKDGVRTILRNVSVAFEPHRNYGILGPSGAGKSTVLRILSGAVTPTSGRVRREGRISWPLGFLGGISLQLSGRENAVFVARLYGASIPEVEAFVEDFAELGAYYSMPASTYSSGMRARLAFALSMAIDFDCYLVDELTAVGDSRFNEKCARAFAERRERSQVIMVSHQLASIRRFCDAGAILHRGQLTLYETIDKAAMAYEGLLAQPIDVLRGNT